MLLKELTRLQPLFVLAMVLSWNAIFIATESTPGDSTAGALVILVLANLFLAGLAGCIKSSGGWAWKLVIREDVERRDVRAVLWIITFFSLALAIFGASAAWRLVHPQ